MQSFPGLLQLHRKLTRKHTGACTLVNNMLREQRINITNPVLSEDPEGNRRRLKVVLYARSHSLSRPVSLAYVLSRSRALLCSTTTFAHALSLARSPQEQMSIYSMQFKAAANAFGRQKVALSGKVGGMKDDVVICLQLGIFYSKSPHLYAA